MNSLSPYREYLSDSMCHSIELPSKLTANERPSHYEIIRRGAEGMEIKSMKNLASKLFIEDNKSAGRAYMLIGGR